MLIPRQRPLVVPVPKQQNFHIEEGKYRAKISRVKRIERQNAHGCVEGVRFLFEVRVPGSDHLDNLAKADFKLDLESGSDLRNVVTRILGKEAFNTASGKTLDLETLAGLDVDIEIEHIITSKRDNYSYPFVHVRDIQRPGRLVEAFDPAVMGDRE